jgi:hypothetical protein
VTAVVVGVVAVDGSDGRVLVAGREIGRAPPPWQPDTQSINKHGNH